VQPDQREFDPQLFVVQVLALFRHFQETTNRNAVRSTRNLFAPKWLVFFLWLISAT
jgi:hypothetical protein